MALAVETLAEARALAAGIDASSFGGGPGGHASLAAGPTLMIDESHRHWTAAGRQTALDRAHQRIADAVASHRPPPLSPALDAELRRLAGVD